MRSDEELEFNLIEKLTYKRADEGNPRSIDAVKRWFAANDQDRIKGIVRELSTNPDTPLHYHDGEDPSVQLTDLSAARTWIARECQVRQNRDLWWID